MADLDLFPDSAAATVKGFALTPERVVDLMVAKLFAGRAPAPRHRLLDPGCGTGEFIAGVLRWCDARDLTPPEIVGIELHPTRASEARRRFRSVPKVEIRNTDFLHPSAERFDFIVGNPPYVAITELSIAERLRFRRDYETATGRFDLYTLFFEQAVSLLQDDGRLVFITPEKYLYVDSAASLRGMFTAFSVDELHFLPEDVFGDLVTYPIVTTLSRRGGVRQTRVVLRNGERRRVTVPATGDSWLPALLGDDKPHAGITLADVCTRVSCGVATGADSVFVIPRKAVTPGLRRFAHDTLSGRQLKYGDLPQPTHKLLIPYDRSGQLLPESELGALADFLREPERRAKLLARTCVPSKPWYSFHETPPMREIGTPKILCKDIGAKSHFALDAGGLIVPRHSVYFIIPRNSDAVEALREYLNSAAAQKWLHENCQRAAKGFLRLQSAVLKRLPVPEEFAAPARDAERMESVPALQSA